MIYLNGNSLGRLPPTTATRLADAIEHEWGTELVDGWDHWIDLPVEVGDELGGALLGAAPGQVLVCDSTTVNLYKLASAALDARPDRRVVVVDAGEFPTDRYVLQGLARARGLEIRHDVDALDDSVALVVRALVDYRSSAMLDAATSTREAREAGALVLWDLSHAVGAVPIELDADAVDLAVGCTYKYLNGGPGAPAFLYVRRELQTALRSPVWGWFAQRDQFEMGPRYEPYDDIRRFQDGTPAVLGLYAVQAGVRDLAAHGIAAIRARSLELTELLIERYDADLAPRGFGLGTPRDPTRRGGHVALDHPDAQRLVAALHGAGIVTDHRAPATIRVAPVAFHTTDDEVREMVRVLAALVSAT